jgi:hypothetical protein
MSSDHRKDGIATLHVRENTQELPLGLFEVDRT